MTPPAYTGLPASVLHKDDAKLEVPAGSSLMLHITASERLVNLSLRQAGQSLGAKVEVKGNAATAALALKAQGGVELVLKAESGLSASEILPFSVIADRPPTVTRRPSATVS